ncbi:MAG: hypothetical protein A2822_04880 [Candidatus Staskawiczbacteria bacterium RIFCSPHIGHO2_01_FULL_41_41]|uniref:Uncharacterized protein n=1 Tax=Candidatus Staskawiczbacteria bacterium RIFCSPHIGHO2_01_FULL_41_41 TaxID=1802203 RepID=A0A1G2HU96_9BACT|nr:MAG: hypothetical protein A2822_04880 [Candidatus Staskawiczbacteria bacterium RIFCSPHIGHO2_01_FULL_41_41]OGZ74405.1 MAG: hypothetical protein A3A12_01385 [Candidatus Staskawiczbacteria bacterium RIFCSPLOWO2_01_FULL_43_17b]
MIDWSQKISWPKNKYLALGIVFILLYVAHYISFTFTYMHGPRWSDSTPSLIFIGAAYILLGLNMLQENKLINIAYKSAVVFAVLYGIVFIIPGMAMLGLVLFPVIIIAQWLTILMLIIGGAIALTRKLSSSNQVNQL